MQASATNVDRPGRSHLRASLCVATLLSIFLAINLSVSGTLIFPYVGAFATSVPLICLEWRRLSIRMVGAACLLLVATVTFFALSIPYAADPSRRLLSIAQLSVALITNYGLFLGLSSMTPRAISRLFLSGAVLILLIATLEVDFGLRPFVDAVRSIIHQEYYEDTARDLQLYGAIRPTVFASEPSLVGIFWGLCLCGWLLTEIDRLGPLRLLIATLLTLCAVFVIRSPTIFYAVTICGVGLILHRLRGYVGPGVRSIRFLLLSACFVVVFASPSLLVQAADEFGGMIEDIVRGDSFYTRQIGPYRLALSMAETRPFFGFGLGGDAEMTPFVVDAFAPSIENMIAGTNAVDVDSVPGMAINFSEGKSSHLITNSFWQFWVSFGILGGIIMSALLALALAQLGVIDIGFALLGATLMGQTMGGVVITPAWTPLFVIAALTMTWRRTPHERVRRRPERLPTSPTRLSACNPAAM